jgi:hypothetical protein
MHRRQVQPVARRGRVDRRAQDREAERDVRAQPGHRVERGDREAGDDEWETGRGRQQLGDRGRILGITPQVALISSTRPSACDAQ